MKRAIWGCLVFALAAGAQRNFDELARRIIRSSVSIKPGQAVCISGGTHNIPLMEALAIEAQNAGRNADDVPRHGPRREIVLH